MKRILLRVPIEYVYKIGFSEAMKIIQKLDILDILDLYQNSMTVLERITFIDPKYHPNDLIGINGINYVKIIKYDKRLNEYLCIVQLENPNCFSNYLKEYKITVSCPILIFRDEMYIPYLSHGKYVKKVFEKVSNIIGDNYSIVKITEYTQNKENLYNLLTSRQLEVATLAASRGYFKNPKQISTAELAKELNITPAAFTEHIRNIKENIFKQIF